MHRIDQAQEEHREIIAAMRVADLARLDGAIRQHNRRAYAAYMAFLKSATLRRHTHEEPFPGVAAGCPSSFVIMLAGGWVAIEAFQGMGRTTRPVRTGKPVETDLPPIAVDFRDVAEAAGLTAVERLGRRDQQKSTSSKRRAMASRCSTAITTACSMCTSPTAQPWMAMDRAQRRPDICTGISGKMTFEDVTQKAGLAKVGWGQGVCVGDYNNDGFRDLFVTHYGQSVLYRNRGDGTFEDATEQAGLRSPRTRWDTGCTFFDYDRDGKLDLAVTNYLEFDRAKVPEAGSGTFLPLERHAGDVRTSRSPLRAQLSLS